MNVIIKMKANILVVAPSGELDHHSAAKIRKETDDSVERLGAKHLVLDFSGLTFMDSAGIGVVIGRYNKIKEIGGRTAITGCNSSVKRILSMAGVFTLVKHYEEVQDAILAVGS